jgi:hypothetical protein
VEQEHVAITQQVASQRHINMTVKAEVDVLERGSGGGGGGKTAFEVEFQTEKQLAEREKHARDAIWEDLKSKKAEVESLRKKNVALQQQVTLLMAGNGQLKARRKQQQQQQQGLVTPPLASSHPSLPKTTPSGTSAVVAPVAAAAPALPKPSPQTHVTDSECLVCYNIIDGDPARAGDDATGILINGTRMPRVMAAMGPCTCWKFCDQCIFAYAPGTLNVVGINLKALTNARGTDLFRCPNCQQSVTRIICDRGFEAKVRSGPPPNGKPHKKYGWDIVFRDGKRPSIFVPTPKDMLDGA